MAGEGAQIDARSVETFIDEVFSEDRLPILVEIMFDAYLEHLARTRHTSVTQGQAKTEYLINCGVARATKSVFAICLRGCSDQVAERWRSPRLE